MYDINDNVDEEGTSKDEPICFKRTQFINLNFIDSVDLYRNNYDKDENYFAELKQVCWLEVTGSIKKDLVPGKTYKASFGVSLSPDAFGWDDCSVYIMAKIGKKGHFHLKKMNLTTIPTTSTDVKISFIPTPGDDLIVQVPLTQPDDDLNLYFGLYEVWTNRWKGGLRIHYALVEMVIHNDTAIPITTQQVTTHIYLNDYGRAHDLVVHQTCM